MVQFDLNWTVIVIKCSSHIIQSQTTSDEEKAQVPLAWKTSGRRDYLNIFQYNVSYVFTEEYQHERISPDQNQVTTVQTLER